MRKSFGGFLLCVLINLLFDLWGILPAAVLLILHFWIGISYLYAILALLLWILVVLVRTAIITYAAHTGESAYIQRPNKNPYSKNTSDYLEDKSEK